MLSDFASLGVGHLNGGDRGYRHDAWTDDQAMVGSNLETASGPTSRRLPNRVRDSPGPGNQAAWDTPGC